MSIEILFLLIFINYAQKYPVTIKLQQGKKNFYYFGNSMTGLSLLGL